MHFKDIKTQIRKQLKTRYPNWKNLNKKEKKQISKKVMDEVVASYDFPKKVTTPVSELVGLSGQQPTRGIMTIEQMAGFVEACQFGVLFKLYGKQSPHPAIKDAELRIIDAII